MVAASNDLTVDGRNLTARSGDGHRELAPLTDDPHGIVASIRRFDEARERLDRRVGASIERLGFDLAAQSLLTEQADGVGPLPDALR